MFGAGRQAAQAAAADFGAAGACFTVVDVYRSSDMVFNGVLADAAPVRRIRWKER